MIDETDSPREEELTPETDAAVRDGDFADLIATARSLERRLQEAQREYDEVRIILAGTDISSLPNDYPLSRMAQNRMDERDKFRWQVIDTCKRAEAAEAERDAALKGLHEAQREHAEWMLMHGMELEAALREAEEHKRALSDVMSLIDIGFLVRDTSKNDEPGWAMNAMAPLRTLAAAKALLDAALAEKGKP